MSGQALILTYHAVEPGSGPLAIEPAVFEHQLDCLHDAGAHVVTISELVAALVANGLPERTVSITFDDGIASAVRVAAPILLERGYRATFFCVAGYLGADNRWPSQSHRATRFSLAQASEIAELAAAGHEIGGHGMEHVPLSTNNRPVLLRELEEARRRLEELAQSTVSTLAWPYGAKPSPAADALLRRVYASSCSTVISTVRETSGPHGLPRVDAWYLRRSSLLSLAARGRLDPYLYVRRLAAGARRVIRHDYELPAA
jgi:peptidoglycan/xylan/chitin deacetylase (PgdA/CDA1 family)